MLNLHHTCVIFQKHIYHPKDVDINLNGQMVLLIRYPMSIVNAVWIHQWMQITLGSVLTLTKHKFQHLPQSWSLLCKILVVIQMIGIISLHKKNVELVLTVQQRLNGKYLQMQPSILHIGLLFKLEVIEIAYNKLCSIV